MPIVMNNILGANTSLRYQLGVIHMSFLAHLGSDAAILLV
jgi:hypothetical protein